MQHKRRQPNTKLLIGVIAVLLVGGGVAALMAIEVPAEQKPIEQSLDAKAFLESKPAQ